jgi:hypothetical protein
MMKLQSSSANLRISGAPPNGQIAGKVGSEGNRVRSRQIMSGFPLAREAILASVLVIAASASISASTLVSHREIVDANTYPWSSIGKVGAKRHWCTGVVVGSNQFLTAAHGGCPLVRAGIP